jgi:hypothetical protein
MKQKSGDGEIRVIRTLNKVRGSADQKRYRADDNACEEIMRALIEWSSGQLSGNASGGVPGE